MATLAATLVGCIVVAAGFFGDTVPFFDTLGQFRAHAAVLLALCGLVLVFARLALPGLVAIALATFAALSVAPFYLPSHTARPAPLGAPRFTLLQMNLMWNAPEPEAAIRLIGALSPDVVTLEEATGQWPRLLDQIAARYPYRFACKDPHGNFDATILSRRPFVADEPGRCGRFGRFAARKVEFGGEAVTVAAVHMRWPWPGGQWTHLAQLQDSLRTFAGPTIVAGDFNGTPWSAELHRVAALTHTQIVPHIGPTWLVQPLTAFLAPYAGLPIDNVLVSHDVDVLDVERQPATSSDHLPLLVTFALPAPEPTVQPTARVVWRQ
ncbi:endonuclease/exonuclease/phosphatase family protein [Jiella sp. M17.18]|uniref:endonuclease/exonuclease/phosphatase family protein n=1 Tax=Jiella sp. M17.18 TaxID=3234247 RepID=UPI0034DE638F